MKKLIASFLVLASALASSLASDAAFWNTKAEQQKSEFALLSPAEKTAKILKANDANGDGNLSKEEVNFRFRVKRFDRVDTNKDGLLDASELTESYRRVDAYNRKLQQQAS